MEQQIVIPLSIVYYADEELFLSCLKEKETRNLLTLYYSEKIREVREGILFELLEREDVGVFELISVFHFEKNDEGIYSPNREKVVLEGIAKRFHELEISELLDICHKDNGDLRQTAMPYLNDRFQAQEIPALLDICRKEEDQEIRGLIINNHLRHHFRSRLQEKSIFELVDICRRECDMYIRNAIIDHLQNRFGGREVETSKLLTFYQSESDERIRLAAISELVYNRGVFSTKGLLDIYFEEVDKDIRRVVAKGLANCEDLETPALLKIYQEEANNSRRFFDPDIDSAITGRFQKLETSKLLNFYHQGGKAIREKVIRELSKRKDFHVSDLINCYHRENNSKIRGKVVRILRGKDVATPDLIKIYQLESEDSIRELVAFELCNREDNIPALLDFYREENNKDICWVMSKGLAEILQTTIKEGNFQIG